MNNQLSHREIYRIRCENRALGYIIGSDVDNCSLLEDPKPEDLGLQMDGESQFAWVSQFQSKLEKSY